MTDFIDAVQRGDIETARRLLDAGADPNASVALPDVSDRIPALYFPCQAGNTEMARLLLERGANPNDGESLYHAAQHDHRECLALLVEFGADLHRGPAQHGNTPLHFLATHTPQNQITPAAMRGLAWLLEAGAAPNVPSHAGKVGHVHAGETPLHRAAAVGHEAQVLRLLADHGAVLDARRDDGATAFQLAVRNGHPATAQALDALGADTTLGPADLLLAACQRADEPAARAVLAASPRILAQLSADDLDILGRAAAGDRRDVVRVMCRVGWPLTHEGEWGGTPLHQAAWHGLREMVQELLDHGAPVNVRDSRYGSSPLGWTAHGSLHSAHANDEDHPAIARLLLDAGATRAESINQWNEPPETMARPSVVAVLRERGFIE